jgi:hypothetical protein
MSARNFLTPSKFFVISHNKQIGNASLTKYRTSVRLEINLFRVYHVVTDLIIALPGNSFVNTNTGNKGNCVFYAICAEQKHGAIRSPFPGNTAINIHPQQWEMVFSAGSVQRST